MADLSKLPLSTSLSTKTAFKSVTFEVPSKDPDKPHFSVTIEADSEKKVTDLLLATLKANDIGYDEVTRTTKWQ